jgi:putative endonuclease
MMLSPSAFTTSRLPVRLVYSEYFDLVVDAIAAERKIKGWSGAKKEALIKGDWKLIQALARRRGGKAKTHPDGPFEARFARTSG